jgi:hypothetical protein
MSFAKVLIPVVASVTVLYSCQVNPRFSKLSSREQMALIPPAIPVADGKSVAAVAQTSTPTEPQVYKVDAEAIQQLVASKEITHVYIYGSFCRPCVAELPAILQLHDANPTVGLVMVTPEGWVELKQVKSFLAARQIGFSTYILDAAKYGDEFSGIKRYHKLLNELHPGYAGNTGFPTHLLLNRQHQVLYAAAGAGRFTAAVLDSVVRANR